MVPLMATRPRGYAAEEQKVYRCAARLARGSHVLSRLVSQICFDA